MSSRNAHMNTSESRYPPRDRSPSRFVEKRSTVTNSAGLLAARITDPALRQNQSGPLAARVSDPHRSIYNSAGRVTDTPHRQNDVHAYSGANREPQREPPRGPKALLEGQRATGYGARGRGFAGRGDGRDREFRELRDAPNPRRGMERDWIRRGRMDSRDSRTSLTGRNRSRSPVPRDFRELRESVPRETDNPRARRDSRDGPLSATSSVSEIPSATNFSNPNNFRERGRVDSEYAKLRGSYPEERDGFRNRSRSRERPWEKKSRDEREPQILEYNRRDDDARRDREEREREADRYRRDLPVFRSDSRNSNRTQLTPSTPVSTSAISLYQANAERATQSVHEPNAEPSRKLSGSIATANSTIGNRDNERNDTLFRAERERQVQPTASPPPQAPQVPAFGSIAYRAPPVGQVATDPKDRFKHESPQVSHSRSTSFDITKDVPSGPKDIFIGNAPTGPKFGQPLERPSIDTLGLARSVSEVERERDRSAYLPTPTNMDSNDTEARREQHHSGYHLSSQPPNVQEALPSRAAEIYSEPHAVQRQRSLQSLQPSTRKDTEEPSRNFSTGINSLLGTSIKPNFHEAASQHSLVKIPTGPRADRTPTTLRQPASPPVRAPPIRPTTAQRPPRQANLKWVRPGLSQHTPRGPSIMNTVPTKRDYAGEEKQRVIQIEREPLKSIELVWSRDNTHSKEPVTTRSTVRSQTEHRIKDNIKIEDTASELKATSQPIEQKDGRFSPFHMRKSTESNELDVVYMDLDDDDFEYERKFELNLQELYSRRPPTPRHHPTLLDLLDECDALASAAEDLTKGTNGSFIESLPLGLPSPKPEEMDIASLKDPPMISALTPAARRKTPPIENLPFLISGPPTPFSETDNRQQNSFHHELVRARILDMLGNQRERVEAENEDLRVEFARRYRDWRMQIEDYEDLKKAEHSITPAPDSPQPTAPPLVNSTPIMEGRRSGKNVSELDLLRVLRESALTHQEEQERRSRETKIPVNLEKEAIIPRMLNRYELESHTFIDTNHLIESHLVIEALAFIPKPDDFTAEEQQLFLDKYLPYPKKWGTIAEALEGRDYQDCVRHYYYTKGEAQYKEKEKVFSRIKKGRRGGRGLQGRPKSNALMPLYDGTLDIETAQIPVTDTGRPKRAVAPTFGQVTDGEPATPATTPARRSAAAGMKGEANGDIAPEKPGRRGRGASVKEKGTRKTRAPLLAAAPAPSPLKLETEIAKPKSKEPNMEVDQLLEEIEGAHLLANLQSIQAVNTPINKQCATEGWPSVTPPIINGPNQAPSPQTPQMNHEPQQQPSRGAQTATSSYWSVPEQQDFQNLVNHFGTDWHAIANHMKSKTHTMVNSRSSLILVIAALLVLYDKAADESFLID